MGESSVVILEAMRAVLARLRHSCEKGWSKEDVASLADSLVRLHERLLLEGQKGAPKADDLGTPRRVYVHKLTQTGEHFCETQCERRTAAREEALREVRREILAKRDSTRESAHGTPLANAEHLRTWSNGLNDAANVVSEMLARPSAEAET